MAYRASLSRLNKVLQNTNKRALLSLVSRQEPVNPDREARLLLEPKAILSKIYRPAKGSPFERLPPAGGRCRKATEGG